MNHSRTLTNSSWALIASNRCSSVVKTWCIALCLLSFPLSTAAQEATAPYEYIKGDRRVVRTQLQLGLNYADAALAVLASGGSEQELQQALALTKKSYVLWRFAWHGVEILHNNYTGERLTSKPDAMLGLCLKFVLHGRLQNLEAQNALQNAIAWPETRAQNVERAVRILKNNSIVAIQKALIVLN